MSARCVNRGSVVSSPGPTYQTFVCLGCAARDVGQLGGRLAQRVRWVAGQLASGARLLADDAAQHERGAGLGDLLAADAAPGPVPAVRPQQRPVQEVAQQTRVEPGI